MYPIFQVFQKLEIAALFIADNLQTPRLQNPKCGNWYYSSLTASCSVGGCPTIKLVAGAYLGTLSFKGKMVCIFEKIVEI